MVLPVAGWSFGENAASSVALIRIMVMMKPSVRGLLMNAAIADLQLCARTLRFDGKGIHGCTNPHTVCEYSVFRVPRVLL